MVQHFQVKPVPIGQTPFECALPLRRRFFPLGFPVDLETNSPDVIDAAQEVWRYCSQTFEETPVRIALAVSDSATVPATLKSEFRGRAHLMSVVADPENFMVCDFARALAAGWITSAVAADHPFLRYRFLTCASHMLIAQLALAPVHAALISRQGRGVVLCGESFSGKSTLAYACARAGFTYITDDGTHLVRQRRDRFAIGDAHTIRLREDARELFPELANRLAIVRPNGKIAIEMFTKDLPIQIATGCSIDHVVFLDRRGHSDPRLRVYPHERALEVLEACASYGAEEVRAAQKRSYAKLLGASTWELSYSHFDDAVTRLEQLVDSGD